MLVEASIIIVVLTLLWLSTRKPSQYPPGPWGLPFIGRIPLGHKNYVKTLRKWRSKNHDIIGWRIGTKYVVVPLDYELYKEIYQHPNFAYRPEVNTLTYMKGDKILGIILTGGARSIQNRRFTLRHMRDFGMGKEKLLCDSHFEAENLINDLKKIVGKPTTLPPSLLISILNTTWQMVGSVRYDFEDQEVKDFIKLASDTHLYGSRLIILDVFPWLKSILPAFLLHRLFKFHVQEELSDKFKAYFAKHIKNHMKDLNEGNVRDYIDAYLLEMEKQKNNPDSMMSFEDLQFCMSDLFEGGTDTTSHTIHWGILYLAKYPKVQEKLQAEIDEVLPGGAQFEMKDKIRLPYTEAFITEILRVSSVAVAPPRQAIEDTEIGSYIIPKGSWALGHTWEIHYDPKYWDSPNEFRPERFLDSDGKFVAPSKAFVPFGLGKRVCIGETISRMQLFVFTTKLSQNFSFSCPPGENINLEGISSPFFHPPDHSQKILITTRKNI